MMRKNGFTLIEVLFVIVIFLAMAFALTPFVQMAKTRARKVACENNLRRINISLHNYATDNKDAFPPSLEALYPKYIDDDRVFDCPSSTRRGTPADPDYKYRPDLTEASDLKEVIVEDREGNHPGGICNAVRIDGSISRINKAR